MTPDQIIHARRAAVLEHAAVVGVTAACTAAGVSRTRYYEWLHKAERYGLAALMPKDRRRSAQPNAMPPEEVSAILAEAVARPTLEARQLLDLLAARGIHRSASGVQKVLRRHHLGRRKQRLAELASITAAETGLVTDAAKDGPAAFSFDFETAEQHELLSIVALYLEVASLDDHLVELRDLIERVQPTRVVLDGLTALERIGSKQSYRGSLLGLTSFVRGAGLATVMTGAPTAMLGQASTSTPFTGLVDTVIVLRQLETGSDIKRDIHIQRMRGSGHSNQVWELLVDDDGDRVTINTFSPPTVENDQPSTGYSRAAGLHSAETSLLAWTNTAARVRPEPASRRIGSSSP